MTGRRIVAYGKNMCQDNCHCHIRRFVAHLKAGQTRRGEIDGREMLIVPVVMARSDVVMNGGLIPVEEFFPASWDGRPVVIDHPEERGEFIGASRPDVLQRSAIGQIFHTRVDGNALKAEAWLDVEKTEKVQPGLIGQLENGVELNVSTGYFADPEPKQGREGGRRYTELHRNLKPDHLAFLPNDKGACSWEDGCGVRFNNPKSGALMKFLEALKATFNAEQAKALGTAFTDAFDNLKAHMTANARGEDDDTRQIRADLISDDGSPFTPDDEMGLQYMSAGALKSLRDQYLKRKRKTNASADEENPKEKDVDETKVKSMIDSALSPLTEAITKLTTNLAEAVKANSLSDADRAALAVANKNAASHRTSLEVKIKANTTMTDDQLKTLDIATVEMIANGIKTAPVTIHNFSGRAAPRANAADNDDPAIKAMSVNSGAVAFFAAKKKEAA